MNGRMKGWKIEKMEEMEGMEGWKVERMKGRLEVLNSEIRIPNSEFRWREVITCDK